MLDPFSYLAEAWERQHGMTEYDWHRLECEDYDQYLATWASMYRWVAEALRQLIAANRADLTPAEKTLLKRCYAYVQDSLEEDEGED